MKEKQEGNDRGQEETIEGEEASMYKEQLDQLDSLDDVLTFGCVSCELCEYGGNDCRLEKILCHQGR